MTKERLAYWISSLLRPEFVSVALFVFVLTHTGLSTDHIIRLGLLYLLIGFILPLLFLIFYLRRHPGQTWELTTRQDRYAYLSVVAVCSLTCLFFTAQFGNQIIFSLGASIFVLLLINFAITFYWKISLHMAALTISVLLINDLSRWQLSYLLLLIPLVGWSRYVLKRHTLAQLICGVLVNSIGLLLLLWFLHFVKFL